MNKKRILIPLAIAALALAAIAAGAQRQADVERQLKAAINTETVDLNPQAAIEQYRKVAASGIRPLAAQALIRMAACYGKLRDAEAIRIYESIVRDYKDQEDAVAEAQARLRALGVSGPEGAFAPRDVTRVSGKRWDAVTPNGRYLLASDGRLRDLVTEKERVIEGADNQTPASSIVSSPDSKQVAHAVLVSTDSDRNRYEVRTLSLEGKSSKVVLRTDEFRSVLLFGWSPEGRELFAMLSRNNGTNQIVAISIANGAVRGLKELEWRWPDNLSLSPDGKSIAYDAPVAAGSANRDIFLLSTDGSGTESPAIVDTTRDALPVWTPDGQALVFVSNRSGTDGFWLIRIVNGKPIAAAEVLKDGLTLPVPIGIAANGVFYYRTGDSPARFSVDTAEVDLASATVPRRAAPLVDRPGYGTGLPEFSPDGKYLVYFAIQQPYRSDQQFNSESVAFESRLKGVVSSSPALSNNFTLDNLMTAIKNAGGLPAFESVLVIRRLGTGEEREIRGLPGPMRFQGPPPAWFPDGQSVVFIGADGSLYRVDVKSGRTLLKWAVSRVNGTGLAVSPDGKHIFYMRGDGDRVLTAFDVETEREVEVFKGNVHPMTNLLISSDGKEIVLRRGAELDVVSLASGSARKLMFEPTSGDGFNPIQWSADGKKVLVQQNKGGDSEAMLFWVPIDGNASERIGSGRFPHIDSMSPDLRLIANTRTTPASSLDVWADPNLFPVRAILTAQISRDGSKVSGPLTRITPSIAAMDVQPAWSPDGKSITFRRGRPDAKYDLIVRSLATGNERVYKGPEGDVQGNPMWFHDGKVILTGATVQGQQTRLRLDLEGGQFRNIGSEIRAANPGQDIGARGALPRTDGVSYSMTRTGRVTAIDMNTWKVREVFTVPEGVSAVGELALSPDDQRLALLVPVGAEVHLAKVGVDGRGYQTLSTSVGSISRMLSWTADGSAILFAQFDPGRTEARIMRMPAVGGKPVFTGLTLKGATQNDTISLSPDGSRIVFSGNPQSVSITDPRTSR